jgi:hypothetical protein
MSVAHSDLVARLQVNFPAQDGSPTTAQYEAAVVSGIAEFSQRDNRIKRASVAIVAGTGSYIMPADFLKLVSFDDIFESSTIVQPGGKLIATNTTMQEELHWFDGTNLVISPTPQYTLTRYFQYKARHVQDANGNYTELGEEEVEISLIAAQKHLLVMLSSTRAFDGFSYTFGDVRIDKTNAVKSFDDAIKLLDKQFEERNKQYAPTTGVRACYSDIEVARYQDLY